MLELVYAPSFIKAYNKLEKALQEEVEEKVELFKNREHHKKLKVHKLQGFQDKFSFSVNYRIRIVFKYGDDTTVYLLLVGSHDAVY
jgi:mRNA-degrading endonuclease YafQ of YafQ-DinJ toxin-antitoxin module